MKHLLIKIAVLAVALVWLIFGGVTIRASTQTDLMGPAGSGEFGRSVTVLPNGNFVVTDSLYDLTTPETVTNVGAVYLYSFNGTLISQLTGSTADNRVGVSGIVVLSNGNFVVNSGLWDNGAMQNVGAVTFCSGTTGCSGMVSSANSLIGASANDFVGGTGVVALSNGNYAVAASQWDNGSIVNVGAVTRCNGTNGTMGIVSAANSLIGTTANDSVGIAVIALPNSNLVVASPSWDNGTIANVGAITWLNGATTAESGVVAVANSLVGLTPNDGVGQEGRFLIKVLSNSNYVVRTINWNGGRGSFTWCDGLKGVAGVISDENSLVGTFPGELISVVENPIIALKNGGYIIGLPAWNGGRGAVVWGNPNGGVSGTISTANALVGTASDENIGLGNGLTLDNGVVVLTNGNYVVGSRRWNNSRGAVTFANGNTGVVGEVSATNSLVGSYNGEAIGESVTALSNGNFVFRGRGPLPTNQGAISWCSGLTGCGGNISSTYRLQGSFAFAGNNNPYSIGVGNITALTNGNYVVGSTYAYLGASQNYILAVTLCSGSSGICGAINPMESLVFPPSRTTPIRQSLSIFPLTNGNYVVKSGYAANAGNAITLCDGIFGCRGMVPTPTSLVGSTDNSLDVSRVIALPNGNYVITTKDWHSGSTPNVGAVTWCNGKAGCAGTMSLSNSLTGNVNTDRIGEAIEVLSNSNYLIKSPSWSSPNLIGAGALTFGAGNIPIIGSITDANSVIGTTLQSNPTHSFSIAIDELRGRIYFGRANENRITIFSTTYTATSDGNFSNLSYDLSNSPSVTDDIIIPSGRNVTLDTNFVGNSLTVQSGAMLTLNGNRTASGKITIDGTLDLGGNTLDVGDNTLTTGCGSTISNTATGYIVGSLQRCVNTTSLDFPVGTANGASPLSLSNISGTGNFTVKTNQGSYPTNPTNLPANRLNRYWTLTNGGLTKTDLAFNYLDSDITTGTESNFRVYKIEAGTAAQRVTLINTAANTATVANVTQFSDWTMAETMPKKPVRLFSGRGRSDR